MKSGDTHTAVGILLFLKPPMWAVKITGSSTHWITNTNSTENAFLSP